MKCPYNRIVEQVNQTRYEYDENGFQNFCEHKLVENYKFENCLGKDCATFWRGRCRRRD